MDEVTQIDSVELTRISAAVLGVAAGLEEIADEMLSLHDSVRGAVEGSAMCQQSMPTAAECWDGSLNALARQVRDFGADLGRSAADYREADALAAARIRASGHPSLRTFSGSPGEPTFSGPPDEPTSVGYPSDYTSDGYPSDTTSKAYPGDHSSNAYPSQPTSHSHPSEPTPSEHSARPTR